ncbi:MAG: hypothetical protein QOF37_2483 [Thermoleophilaceae bacterium]|jgi:hypothetical protein|nr:hypothetical protein [Thermoleophilaceae bacterium]
MRERRGPLGRTVGAAVDSIASAARRGGPRAGEPRVVVYDAGGHATLVRAETPEHERILGLAEEMIGLWSLPSDASNAPQP